MNTYCFPFISINIGTNWYMKNCSNMSIDFYPLIQDYIKIIDFE